ncbi:glutaminase A [Herbaspirillum sp. CF444]|nr:glutaminase A [Herbaspirillum sp. CF444]
MGPAAPAIKTVIAPAMPIRLTDKCMKREIDYQRVLDEMLHVATPLTHQGAVADYIPELARVASGQFGVALCLVDGTTFSAGAADTRFSIQSVSKLFTLSLAYRLEGDALWRRVGREPSGTPFNSLVQLEIDHGIPRNPFVNAGALVVTDTLCSHYAHPSLAILDFLREISGAGDVNFNSAVAESEAGHGHRNAAMAHFIKSFGNLATDVDAVLQTYFQHCSIEMSCVELARAALFVANHGVVPHGGKAILTPLATRRLNAILLTCGTYNAAGDFAFKVGLPAKSGVGGGIVAIVPGQLAICVWSPTLDEYGNSVAGVAALEHFSALTAHSVFQ